MDAVRQVSVEGLVVVNGAAMSACLGLAYRLVACSIIFCQDHCLETKFCVSPDAPYSDAVPRKVATSGVNLVIDRRR